MANDSARSTAPTAVGHTSGATSKPLTASQGKMLVVASGLVTGKGRQVTPTRIMPSPSSLGTLFVDS